jgi:hypothetical protein
MHNSIMCSRHVAKLAKYYHGRIVPRNFSTSAVRRSSLFQGQIPLINNGKDVTTDLHFPPVGPLEKKEVWRASSKSVQHAHDAAGFV